MTAEYLSHSTIRIVPRIDSELRTCIYFTQEAGLTPGCRCQARVVYDDVKVNGPFRYRVDGTKTIYSEGTVLPCHQDNCLGLICKKAKFPSKEKQAKDQAAYVEQVQLQVHKHLRSARTVKCWWGSYGSFECPRCGKTLRYQKIPLLRRLRIRCDTYGCLKWTDY